MRNQSNLRRLQGLCILTCFLVNSFCVENSKIRHFGSKTPYDIRSTTDWQHVLQQDAHLAPTCQLFHVRMVARHGTRSPDIKNIEGVKKGTKRLSDANVQHANHGSKSQQELRQKILTWKNQLPDGKRLLDRGRAENRFLAGEFFNLIDHHSNMFLGKNSFHFHATEIQRSFESGVAFREEFVRLINAARFQATWQFNVGNVTRSDDHLYFHKNCPAFTQNVDRANRTSAETKRVRFTPEAIALVEKVNRQRLGLPSITLEWNNIFAFYQMAAFEVASLNSSIFLELFDESDLQFLEYADELDNYWKKAYGHPLIADISCSLTTHIFDTALRKIGGISDHDGIFEFAHLETLLPVYTAFQLFDDGIDNFLANATRDFIVNRQFIMSKVGPFAGNFAFLFFVCPDSEEAFKNEYKVVLMVNGKPIALKKACADKLACPIQLVRQAYGLTTGPPSDCKLKEMCQLVPEQNEVEGKSRFKSSREEKSSESIETSRSSFSSKSSSGTLRTLLISVVAFRFLVLN